MVEKPCASWVDWKSHQLKCVAVASRLRLCTHMRKLKFCIKIQLIYLRFRIHVLWSIVLLSSCEWMFSYKTWRLCSTRMILVKVTRDCNESYWLCTIRMPKTGFIVMDTNRTFAFDWLIDWLDWVIEFGALIGTCTSFLYNWTCEFHEIGTTNGVYVTNKCDRLQWPA